MACEVVNESVPRYDNGKDRQHYQPTPKPEPGFDLKQGAATKRRFDECFKIATFHFTSPYIYLSKFRYNLLQLGRLLRVHDLETLCLRGIEQFLVRADEDRALSELRQRLTAG